MSQNPICPACKNQMDEVESFKAKKDDEEVVVTVYSCFKDRTFDRTVKGGEKPHGKKEEDV